MIFAFGDKVPLIAPDAFVAANAAVIGDVEIASGASVWFACTLRGDDHKITIGPRTNVQDGTVIHVFEQKYSTTIGADVTIGHNAMLHGCVVEDLAMVGISSVVLDGATIETGGILAAGAVLAPGKRIKAGELWAGVPAKLVRPVTEAERVFIRDNAAHYAKRAGQFLSGFARPSAPRRA
ncbi:MAG: gamma carbonic anhydrase family protein [Alphaproteobacteria bacterium]|nr:gamma carbonic anhydrase family protein [Alphaproteobacteria bacterium]